VVDGQDLLGGRARAGGDGRPGLRTLDEPERPTRVFETVRMSGDPACRVKTALGARPGEGKVSVITDATS
jgi:hypothetical protein